MLCGLKSRRLQGGSCTVHRFFETFRSTALKCSMNKTPAYTCFQEVLIDAFSPFLAFGGPLYVIERTVLGIFEFLKMFEFLI